VAGISHRCEEPSDAAEVTAAREPTSQVIRAYSSDQSIVTEHGSAGDVDHRALDRDSNELRLLQADRITHSLGTCQWQQADEHDLVGDVGLRRCRIGVGAARERYAPDHDAHRDAGEPPGPSNHREIVRRRREPCQSVLLASVVRR
jgi:hypothetical protein